jgi:hypothetical protein|tara:strand:- start:907 stop:1182 length:276 start_codon:yes stop_codon:yes gene_type:complete
MADDYTNEEEAYINSEFVDIITSEKWDFPVPFVIDNPEQYENMSEWEFYAPPTNNMYIVWSVENPIIQEMLEEITKRLNEEKGNDNGESAI